MIGFSILKAARFMAGAAGVLTVLSCLSGCGAEFPPYPSDLKYPQRTEPIIKATLTTVPPKFEKPGELYTVLWGLDEEDRRKNVLYPKAASDNEKKQIAELEEKLEKLFGTPAQPTVGGVDDDFKQALKLDDETLSYGSRLYRVHCLHCHGVAGNGYALLRAASLQSREHQTELMHRVVETLERTALRDGDLVNWLPTLDSPADSIRVQWKPLSVT